MLISAVYHSQINSQFKQTNQTVKIALQYTLSDSDKTDKVFITILFYLQDSLNNATNVSTDYALNKLTYSFHINDILNALTTDLSSENYTCLHQILCEKAEQVIIFVNVISKSYYNISHQLITMKSDATVYLCLFHEYIISDLVSKKFSNQQVSSFHILKCVE